LGTFSDVPAPPWPRARIEVRVARAVIARRFPALNVEASAQQFRRHVEHVLTVELSDTDVSIDIVDAHERPDDREVGRLVAAAAGPQDQVVRYRRARRAIAWVTDLGAWQVRPQPEAVEL